MADTEGRYKTGEGKQTKAPEFEDILDVVGHFRRYQLMMLLLLNSTDFSLGMAMLYFTFSNDVPEWKCLKYDSENFTEFHNNTTYLIGQNETELWNKDMAKCEINGTKCIEYEFRGEVTIISEVSAL